MFKNGFYVLLRVQKAATTLTQMTQTPCLTLTFTATTTTVLGALGRLQLFPTTASAQWEWPMAAK